MLGFIGGVIIGGAVMYYIQPSIKLAVAKMFGWEADLVEQYRKQANAIKPPTPSK